MQPVSVGNKCQYHPIDLKKKTGENFFSVHVPPQGTIDKVQTLLDKDFTKRKFKNWVSHPNHLLHVTLLNGINLKKDITAKERKALLKAVTEKIGKVKPFDVTVKLDGKGTRLSHKEKWVMLNFTSDKLNGLQKKVVKAVEECVKKGSVRAGVVDAKKLSKKFCAHISLGTIDCDKAKMAKDPEVKKLNDDKKGWDKLVAKFNKEMKGGSITISVGQVHLLGSPTSDVRVNKKHYSDLAYCNLGQ